MPPTLKEFADRIGCSLKDLEPLVQVAVDEGRLVRLSPELAITCDALESLRQNLADYFQLHPAAKISEIREQWGMTRKHAVPIFEFFDRQQITARSGDLRTAGPRFRCRSTRRAYESSPSQNLRLLPAVDRVLNLH